MSETWIDVKPADVRVGDEVRVDGIGVFTSPSGPTSPAELSGWCYETVSDAWLVYVSIKDGDGSTRFRRSSIVAARRKVEDRVKDHHCAEPGCYATVTCDKKCDAHTPKEPKREPGCGARHSDPPFLWLCTHHEGGEHLAIGHLTGDVMKRWPIEAPEPKVGEWRCKDSRGALIVAPTRVCMDCEVRRSTGWSKDTRTGQPWALKAGDTVTRTDIYTVRLVKQLSERVWEYDQPHDGCFKYEPIDRRAGDKKDGGK